MREIFLFLGWLDMIFPGSDQTYPVVVWLSPLILWYQAHLACTESKAQLFSTFIWAFQTLITSVPGFFHLLLDSIYPILLSIHIFLPCFWIEAWTYYPHATALLLSINHGTTSIPDPYFWIHDNPKISDIISHATWKLILWDHYSAWAFYVGI